VLPPLAPGSADVDLPEDLPQLKPEYAPQRIAITGATGAIGTHFLSRMLHRLPGLRVTALVRGAATSSWPLRFNRLMQQFGDRITLVHQDLQNFQLPPAQRKMLAESEGLWHFAGNTMLHGRQDDQIAWHVNDAGTQAILDLLASADQPSPLYHISTAYVCGERTGTIFEDDHRPATFRNSYEASKFAAEQRVRHAMKQGLRGRIFRPSVVVDDQSDCDSSRIIDLVAAAVVMAARTGEPLYLRLPAGASINAIHSDWLFAATTTLAGACGNNGRTYHLTARQPLQLKLLAEIAATEQRDWKIVLDPNVPIRDLPPASRRLDRVLAPFVPYLNADLQFDRAHFEQDAPHLAGLCELNVQIVLRFRRKLACVPTRIASAVGQL
jgi:nucleoside-diphosphate-sugar epimerase